jgi:hypothetical protein
MPVLQAHLLLELEGTAPPIHPIARSKFISFAYSSPDRPSLMHTLHLAACCPLARQ